MPAKECPLCGTPMQLRISERLVRVPGNPKTSAQPIREWFCPECDHFEEAEEETG